MFDEYLAEFAEYPRLRATLERVLESLPTSIQEDFLSDSSFHVTLENFVPGEGSKLFMPCPVSIQAVSRQVVLRPKLEKASEKFALYVVAHEFAHAYLRNGGWQEYTDREEAADALAASWGYSRPAFASWFG